MSYNNPTILDIAAPTGLDATIESIRAALQGNLDWLEKSFGRAWEFKEKDVQGNIVKYPKVYTGSKEYLNVLPNDFLRAQSFIKVSGPEQWEIFNRFEGSMKTRKLSIIFWVNLKDINASKDYIFIDQLKDQVEAVLSGHPQIKAIDAYYDERVEDVFDGYTINDTATQYLMYPYAGMRFDITAMYEQVCEGSGFADLTMPRSTNLDLEFIVGTPGYEIEGATVYQNDLLKGWRVRLFRNTAKQHQVTLPNTFYFTQTEEDVVAGQFSVYPAFQDEEVIGIEKY